MVLMSRALNELGDIERARRLRDRRRPQQAGQQDRTGEARVENMLMLHQRQRRERTPQEVHPRDGRRLGADIIQLFSPDKHRWAQIIQMQSQKFLSAFGILSVLICVHLWAAFCIFLSERTNGIVAASRTETPLCRETARTEVRLGRYIIDAVICDEQAVIFSSKFSTVRDRDFEISSKSCSKSTHSASSNH